MCRPCEASTLQTGPLPAFMSPALDIGAGQPTQPQSKHALWRFGEVAFNKTNFLRENAPFNEQPDFDWAADGSAGSSARLRAPAHRLV